MRLRPDLAMVDGDFSAPTVDNSPVSPLAPAPATPSSYGMPSTYRGIESFAQPMTSAAVGASDEDYYFKKVGNTGLTQAQIDSRTDAKEIATLTGQAINPVTGMIVKSGTSGSVSPTTYVPTAPVTSYAATTSAVPEVSSEQRDAFKFLEDVFTSYGLSSLVPRIRELMVGIKDPATGKIQQIGPNEATILLRQTPEYQSRFAGNYDPKTGRVARGLNALSERDYLLQENAYSEMFRMYGVDKLATKDRMAGLIGGDISPTELNKRLNLAVTNVQQADPNVLATLKAYYPAISNRDLVSYFLAPEETLPELQNKVAAAEIGGEAMAQGFKTETGLPGVSMTRAEELARAGVTQEQARTGFAKVKFELPTATKLSDIYKSQTGTTYGQADLENQYLLSNAEAAQRQRELNKLEEAQFSGSTGTNVNVPFLRRPTTGRF